MTLRSDVSELLARAAILDVDVDDAVADEHLRSSAYRRVVLATASSRSRDGDRAIAAVILRDPEEMVSKTAVVALVDSIAMKATDPAEFRQWSAGLLPETDRLRTEEYRAFIRRRVHDWLFHLSVEAGHVPTPAELAEVTDWMQRLLAHESTSPEVLALLAGSGSRKKIRNVAKDRARNRGLRGAVSRGEAQAKAFSPGRTAH
ncbi:hypothetical protein AB0O39_12070 [Streptomyces anulatus]|uniref:hypothetical protein n=1 Tax=Streptomyces anulatus TaxID=1892 RepID=UPI00343CDF52